MARKTSGSSAAIPAKMTSRERLLAAIEYRPVDYVPCSFWGWSALQAQCADLAEYIDKQLEMGLDPVVRTCEMDVRMHPQVTLHEWLAPAPAGGSYPVLHKEYRTPVGTLAASVNKTDDWPYGDHVPLWDDFLIPRYRKCLVTPQDNLDALRYVLSQPDDADVAAFRRRAKAVKKIAVAHNLQTAGAYVMMGDMANWLAGLEQLLMATVDAPDFVHGLLDIIEGWNKPFIELSIEEGADLIVRRGWYENADFWSPRMYREFLFPGLKRQAERVHSRGAKFGYLVSCSSMPLIDMMMESGVDVLLGIDPAQDRMMDYELLKKKTASKMALWGGVCGYLTIECGSPDDIRREVRQAVSALAPGSGFILSPMTNIRDESDKARQNTRTMIETWRQVRNVPHA